MREIKFRVWDVDGKQFWDDSSGDWKIEIVDGVKPQLIILEERWIQTNPENSNDGYQDFYWDVVENCVFQQFTGLKDQNGKEIYEGDIIRREFEIGRVIIDPVSLGAEDYEIEDSGYFIGVVSFRPSEGYVLNKCKKFNDEDELQSKKSGVKLYANRAEVIGNIYENPEILETGE